MWYAGATAPAGWLVCNGDGVPNDNGTVQGKQADWTNLFAVLGTTYGVRWANNRLPNLQGTFVRGWTEQQTTRLLQPDSLPGTLVRGGPDPNQDRGQHHSARLSTPTTGHTQPHSRWSNGQRTLAEGWRLGG